MSPTGRTEAAAERSELVRNALELARELHVGEFREVGDDVPFIDHPLAVAELLAEQEFGEEALAAGLLHDTIEYTHVGLNRLRQRFGMKVAMIVLALTEDEEIESYEERKEELRGRVEAAGADAQRVFAADKVANVIALREACSSEGEEVEEDMAVELDRQILIWEYDMEMLFAVEEGVPLFDRLSEELLKLWQMRIDEWWVDSR